MLVPIRWLKECPVNWNRFQHVNLTLGLNDVTYCLSSFGHVPSHQQLGQANLEQDFLD